MDPILSICIPTYNGGQFLVENLKEIFWQITTDKISGVEVIVSDNCSVDSTPIEMRKFQKEYPDIFTYNRNEQNIGYDANLMKLVDLAKGKFIHFMGDDDNYTYGGILKLLSVLDANPDLSVAVLSNLYYRQSVGLLVDRKGLNTQYLEEDKLFTDPDSFFTCQEDRIWPVTNLVFNKSYLNSIPGLEKCKKKDWIHIYLVLYIAKKFPKTYIVADSNPIVINRVDVQKWRNRVDGPRIYWNNIYIHSLMLELGYSSKTFEKYAKWYLKNRLSDMRFTRPIGLTNKLSYLERYFSIYKNNPKFYLKFLFKFLF